MCNKKYVINNRKIIHHRQCMNHATFFKSFCALSKMLSVKYWTTTKLQQQERLRCEDTPPLHDYPYYWFILDPKSKQDKVKVTNLKNLPKLLLDKMCKYEMDLASIVEDTGRSRFCPQVTILSMGVQTDGRTDRRTRWNQYTPLSTSLKQEV